MAPTTSRSTPCNSRSGGAREQVNAGDSLRVLVDVCSPAESRAHMGGRGHSPHVFCAEPVVRQLGNYTAGMPMWGLAPQALAPDLTLRTGSQK